MTAIARSLQYSINLKSFLATKDDGEVSKIKSKRFIYSSMNLITTKIFLLLFFCLIPLTNLHARLRFVGPNPYYSFSTYPQDSKLFNRHSSIFFLYYENRGWMGHLDIPEISPSPNYVATEESVQENYYGVKIAEASFRGKWFTPSILAAPYVFDIKGIRFIPLVSGQLDIFKLNASGETIYYGENFDFLIPFSSKLSQVNSEMSLGLLASTSIKNIPIGMLFNYKYYAEERPSGYLKFTIDGQETRLNRFNWGWSTLHGCNHIFGGPTSIDAFWQDEYTHTKGSQFDFTIGADIKENKLGFRFRKTTEYGDYYSYEEPLNQYFKSKWSDKTSKTTLRTYEVFKITNVGSAKLFLCGVLEADFIGKKYTKEGVELLDSYNEHLYATELLPFIHFDISGGGFFRIGTSASFFWNDYAYREVWGNQEVYSHGWPYFGWEPYWERSSYGNSFTFINFTEADLELYLWEEKNLMLSLDFWSHQVFRTTKRYYGHNEYGNDAFSFHKAAERKNYLRESWFGGTFGIMAGRKLSLGLFLDLPVYYDKFETTEISGEEGDFFSGRSDAQPAVRQPVRLWAMIIVKW